MFAPSSLVEVSLKALPCTLQAWKMQVDELVDLFLVEVVWQVEDCCRVEEGERRALHWPLALLGAYEEARACFEVA